MKTVWVQITNHGTGAAPAYYVYGVNPPDQYGPYSYLGNIAVPLSALETGINFSVDDSSIYILLVELGGCESILFLPISTTTTTTSAP